MDASAVVRANGGVARTRDFLRAGLTARQLGWARRSGLIERVRIGWYVDPALDGGAKAALRVGGRLTCVSACEFWGAGRLRSGSLHVEVEAHDSRFRLPEDHGERLDLTRRRDVVLHWVPTRGTGTTASPVDAMLAAMQCLPKLELICVLDSMLHVRPQLRAELERRIPPHRRGLLAMVEPRTESVPESVFRIRLLAAGIACQVQAALPYGLRADFLLGDRLVVEIDGSEYHSGHTEFVRDRERDALLTALGYQVLHFTYRQVVDRWEEVIFVLRAVIRRGDHLTRR